MSALRKSIFTGIATVGISSAALADTFENDIHKEETFRTGVILEADCGNFSNANLVELCIKSSAWEMADIALSTKDAIRQSGLGLGQGFALTKEIDDKCDPRKQLRNLSEKPKTLSEFRDVTVVILEGCSTTIRGNIRAANEMLNENGLADVYYNRARLGLLTEHTQWLSGLDLSEFDPQENTAPSVEQSENGLIIRIP